MVSITNITINPSNGDLIIPAAQYQDSGQYFCRIRSIYFGTELRVTETVESESESSETNVNVLDTEQEDMTSGSGSGVGTEEMLWIA